MDITRWQTRTIVLDSTDGSEASVLVRPLTSEWSARLIEAQPEQPAEGADPPTLARAVRAAGAAALDLHRALLRDLVVEFRGVTLGEKAATRDEILDALPEAEVAALVRRIVRSGEVSAEQGKG